MKKLFSHDADLGLTRYFHYDEATDQATISTHQDITPLLEQTKRVRNQQTKLDRWGDGRVVAQIPLSIYYEWLKEGKTNDDAFIRRWLNDKANEGFRTFIGKV